MVDDVVNGAGQAVSAVPASVPSADELEICPDCMGAGGDNNTYVCPRCNGSGGVMPEQKVLLPALVELRKWAAVLYQNSVGCAQNHYGHDFAQQGTPGWLVDASAAIHAADVAIYGARRAQAIEARRAATTGAVHESAVRQDAPDPGPLTNQDGGEKL